MKVFFVSFDRKIAIYVYKNVRYAIIGICCGTRETVAFDEFCSNPTCYKGIFTPLNNAKNSDIFSDSY